MTKQDNTAIDKVIATYLEGLHNPHGESLYNELRADRDTKALKQAIQQHTEQAYKKGYIDGGIAQLTNPTEAGE